MPFADARFMTAAETRTLFAAAAPGTRLLYHIAAPKQSLMVDRRHDRQLHERAGALYHIAMHGRGRLDQEKLPSGATAYFILKVDSGGLAVASAARAWARRKNERLAQGDGARFAHAGCNATVRLRGGSTLTVRMVGQVGGHDGGAVRLRYELTRAQTAAAGDEPAAIGVG